MRCLREAATQYCPAENVPTPVSPKRTTLDSTVSMSWSSVIRGDTEPKNSLEHVLSCSKFTKPTGHILVLESFAQLIRFKAARRGTSPEARAGAFCMIEV
jgi:hypothetical protein